MLDYLTTLPSVQSILIVLVIVGIGIDIDIDVGVVVVVVLVVVVVEDGLDCVSCLINRGFRLALVLILLVCHIYQQIVWFICMHYIDY